jgi:hypothetical protein
MTVIFETSHYGRIEVARENSRGDSSGCAYFRKGDYEAPVGADGTFADWWGTPFRVHWPIPHGASPDASLEVTAPRTVAFARPA